MADTLRVFRGCSASDASWAARSPAGWLSRRCSPTSPVRRSCCRTSTHFPGTVQRRLRGQRHRPRRRRTGQFTADHAALGPRAVLRASLLIGAAGGAGLLTIVLLGGIGLIGVLPAQFLVVSSIGLVFPQWERHRVGGPPVYCRQRLRAPGSRTVRRRCRQCSVGRPVRQRHRHADGDPDRQLRPEGQRGASAASDAGAARVRQRCLHPLSQAATCASWSTRPISGPRTRSVSHCSPCSTPKQTLGSRGDTLSPSAAGNLRQVEVGRAAQPLSRSQVNLGLSVVIDDDLDSREEGGVADWSPATRVRERGQPASVRGSKRGPAGDIAGSPSRRRRQARQARGL